MKRRTFDVLASLVGLGLAAVLIVAGSLLTWAHNFVQDEVHSQLAAQRVYFPPKGSDSITELKGADFAAINKYAGQQLTTGDQAAAYADHFIAVHLKAIGGGKTYAELSGAYLALSDEQKAAPDGVALNGTVQTMFKGETLRGLLLNAYAFGKMGTIAGIAAVAAFIGAGVMLVLGGLGLWHSRRAPESKEVLTGHHHYVPEVEHIR
jgi:hypothetical protein